MMENNIRLKILKCINKDKYVSGQALAHLCHLSTSTVSRYLKELQDNDIIYREDKNSPWYIQDNIKNYDESYYEEEIDLEANIIEIERTYTTCTGRVHNRDNQLANDRRSLRLCMTSPNGRLYKSFKTLNPKRMPNISFFKDHTFPAQYVPGVTIKKVNDCDLSEFNLLLNYFSACKSKYLEVHETNNSVWKIICDIVCTDALENQLLLIKVLKDYLYILNFLKGLDKESNEKSIVDSLKIRQNESLENDGFRHSRMSNENVYFALSKDENHLALYWMLWCFINEIFKNNSFGKNRFTLFYTKK